MIDNKTIEILKNEVIPFLKNVPTIEPKLILPTLLQRLVEKTNLSENQIDSSLDYLDQEGFLLNIGISLEQLKLESKAALNNRIENESKSETEKAVNNILNRILDCHEIGLNCSPSELASRLENLANDANKAFNKNVNNTITLLDNPPTKNELSKRLLTENDGFYSGYEIRKGNENQKIYLKSGALTFLASPTKHGKTTLMINLFKNALKNYKDKIHYFFSYEEGTTAIIPKIFSCFLEKKLSADNYRSLKAWFKNGNSEFISEESKKDYTEKDLREDEKHFWETLKNSRVIYQNLSLPELIKALKILANKPNTGIIFIDYLQLIPLGESANIPRHEIIKELCNQLKDIAVKLNLTIVIGTQFNRAAINPEALTPQNLAEGSDVEKSANQIIALWHFGKKAVYNKAGEKGNYKDLEADSVLIKIIANRDGESEIESVFKCDYNIRLIENTKRVFCDKETTEEESESERKKGQLR